MSPFSLPSRQPTVTRALAGALVAAGLCGRFAGADDDVADASLPRGRAPVVEVATPDEAGDGPFVVSLANGDRLTGTIVGLDSASLRFQAGRIRRPAIDLPLAKIEDIGRSTTPQPFEPRGDRLYPVAGGVIHGSLAGINARGITIDAHLVGSLTVPLEAVAAFVREGSTQPDRTAAARFHEIHDVSGSRLVGHVEFSPSGAAVAADGLTATVAIRQVAAILFPTDGRGNVGEGAEPSPPCCTLELLNGSAVVGIDPRLERDRLAVEVGPGRRVAVPVDNVARVSFGTGPGAGRRIVFWSQFADLDEEAAHMAEALRAGLPRGWTLEADGAGPPADELATALRTAGVLVVPEMEKFGAGGKVDAAAVGRDLKAFLGRGGTVVIAGGDDSAGFWEEAGIFSLSSTERVNGKEFRFVRGHPLGRDVGDSFAAVNGTSTFKTEDPGLEAVAQTPAGAAVVLVKKVGRGSVVLLGMDYYKRSEAIDRVLVNAVMLGRGR